VHNFENNAAVRANSYSFHKFRIPCLDLDAMFLYSYRTLTARKFINPENFS